MADPKHEPRLARSLEAALDAIPLFPLPRVVLFPDALLPLHVFEPRYRAMLKDCLATHGALAIVHLRAAAGELAFSQIVGGGVVVEHDMLPDGRSNIVVVGTERLRLEEVTAEDPPRMLYRRARATILRDRAVEVPQSQRAALVAAATMFASEVKKHDPSFSFRVPASASAGRLADACAYQLIVDAHARQAVLEELDPRVRIEMVMSQLALQHGAMLRDVPGGLLN